MMEDVNESVLGSRNFGHGRVTWKIKNYGLSLWQKFFQVETPVFRIIGAESRYTKWQLILETTLEEVELVKMHPHVATPEPSGAAEAEPVEAEAEPVEAEAEPVEVYLENCELVLNLQREDSDVGDPKTVWANWKVYLMGKDGVKFGAGEGEHYFERGDKHSLHLGTIFDWKKGISFDISEMTLICNIIVVDRDYQARFDVCDDIDLCALSEDLHWVFTHKMCDQQIKISEAIINAHQALLYVRSSYFQIKLKQKDNQVLDLQGFKYDSVMSILEYLYSGDICDILQRPSVSTYRFLYLAGLQDLISHFKPQQVKINTKIDVQKSVHVWRIDRFSEEENCLSSPILSNNPTEAAWQIHLYPKGFDSESEYAAISVEYIEGQLCDNLNIQCAIVDDGEESLCWKTLQKSTEQIFTNEKFVMRDVLLREADRKDGLKLCLKVQMCPKEKHSSIETNVGNYVAFSNEMALEKLSNDLSTLYDNKKFSDLTIEVDNGVKNKLINAHRFIIYARSVYLSCILDENRHEYMRLSNVDPETVTIALKYMYCAKLDVKNVAVLLDVYKFADEYLVSRLKEKCVRVLSNSFTVDTVCDVLNVADDYKDSFLKEAALEFVLLNIEDISALEAWQNLMTKKPQLCRKAGISLQEVHEEMPDVSSDETTQNDVNEKSGDAHDSGKETAIDNDSCPIILHNDKLKVMARTSYMAEINLEEQSEHFHRRRKYSSLPTTQELITIDPKKAAKDENERRFAERRQKREAKAKTKIVKAVSVEPISARPKKVSERNAEVPGKKKFPRNIADSKTTKDVIAQKDSSTDSKAVTESAQSSLQDSSAGKAPQGCGGSAQQIESFSEVAGPKDEIKACSDSGKDLETEVQTLKDEAEEGQRTSVIAENARKTMSKDSTSDKPASKQLNRRKH